MQPFFGKGILILLCLFSFYLQAQEEITMFTRDDGLTSTLVTNSHVDSKGVVWIGTTNGLNAFTSKNWIPIKHIEDNNSGRLKPLGNVHSIFEDLRANIWVSSDQGLFLYNRKYWTFFEPEDDKEYVTKAFLQARSGAIWIVQEHFQNFTAEMGFEMVSGKLQMYKDGRWFKFDNDLAGSSALKLKERPEYFSSVIQDMQGNMWFATLEGVFMFDGNAWSSFKDEELDATKIFDLIEDKDGVIWVATENGVSRKHDEKWENFSKKDGLADNYAYRILEDPQGRKWTFSRNGSRFTGLSMLDDNHWTSFDVDDVRLKGEIESIVWFGSDVFAFSKDGVSVFRDDKWRKFGKADGLADKNYSLIINDRNKYLWLAGDHGLYQFNDGKWDLLIGQTEKWNVLKIFRDKRGRIWVATNKMGLFVLRTDGLGHYDEENGLADNHVSDIFEDRHQNIWVITKKGLSRIVTLD